MSSHLKTAKYLMRLELVVFGFIRREIELNIPKEIALMCFEFYPKIEIVFDVSCDKGKKFISSDGLTLDISQKYDYVTFASHVGWNEGIHSFTLKQLKGEENIGGIGIISAIEPCKTTEFSLANRAEKYTVYYLDGNGTIYEHKPNSYGEKMCGGAKWTKNDTITVVIDCDKWKIQFYKNNGKIGNNIPIQPNETYYAAYTAWGWNTSTKVALVETEIDI